MCEEALLEKHDVNNLSNLNRLINIYSYDENNEEIAEYFNGVFIITHNQKESIGFNESISIKLDRKKQKEIKELNKIRTEEHSFIKFLSNRILSTKQEDRLWFNTSKNSK